LAQGKVGSGFDISSSVYGTHIYKRFSPSLLEPLLSSNSPPSLVEALDPKKWDQSISPFRLPKGLRLVLADVDAGTNTPSFIRGILKWREEKPEESNEIWGKLFKANTRLVKALEHLRGLEGEEEYGEVLEAAAGLPIEQVSPLYRTLPTAFMVFLSFLSNIRSSLVDCPSGLGSHTPFHHLSFT
jgi:phosphomevalonate kinase